MDLRDKRFHLTKKRLEALDKLGLHDSDEVLSYYPYRYDILNCRPFSEWKEKDKVAFEAVVSGPVRTWRRGHLSTSTFEVMAYDRVLKITIFNRPWAKNLALEQTVTIQGIYMGKNRVTAMNYDTKPLKEHDAVTPVYSVKEGIQQKTVRTCVQIVYDEMQNEIHDLVPQRYIRAYRLLHKAEALYRIHFPKTPNDIRLAERTLKYEEFLRFFTALECSRKEESSALNKPVRRISMDLVKQAIRALPFELTRGQYEALLDILKDMSSTKCMYRLVQGDVGCGKTAVAALAMYACVKAGYQCALLAPTEILARQHLLSFRSLIQDASVISDVLYSGLSNADKKRILEDTAEGKIHVLIGTHSLIQDEVTFHNLGLVVADEQQRFGVEQRKKLREKGDSLDFLLMSATPIPRTLASTLFADMDLSTIETLPQGRRAPITVRIAENSFRSVLNEVQALLGRGRQLYVICAAVEDNPEYHARNVYDTAKALTTLFPQYKTAVLHGRMSSDEKQSVMQEFADNKAQILVSTTVVEVGMNVVNATGMIIYDADRFGMSQLHQLRGRIQRGSEQGYCWLLSGSQDPSAIERLDVLTKTSDGFEISYQDLRLRGPGDILGTRQSGVPGFILGNVIDDTDIIRTARKDAQCIVQDPDDPEHIPMLEEAAMHAGNYMD